MEENGKQCSPVCEFFQCGQRKLIDKKGSDTSSGTVCGWVGDPCERSKCAYGMCFKGKLRPNGSCGLLERTVPSRRSRHLALSLEQRILESVC